MGPYDMRWYLVARIVKAMYLAESIPGALKSLL